MSCETEKKIYYDSINLRGEVLNCPMIIEQVVYR